MHDRPVDGVERGVEVFRQVSGEEAQDVAAIFLEQRVPAAVAAVGVRV